MISSVRYRSKTDAVWAADVPVPPDTNDPTDMQLDMRASTTRFLNLDRRCSFHLHVDSSSRAYRFSSSQHVARMVFQRGMSSPNPHRDL